MLGTSQIDWTSVPVHEFWGLFWSSKLRKNIRSILKQEDIDLIHVHGSWRFPAYAAVSEAIRVGIPIVITPHSSLQAEELSHHPFRKKLAWYGWARRTLRRASVIQATDPQEASDIARLASWARIVVIPNGVNTDEFSKLPKPDEARKSLGLPTDIRVILFMGRLYPRKRVLELLESWSRLAQPGWTLVVAGPDDDDSYYQECRRRSASQIETGAVRFVGFLRGKSKLDAYAVASALILPSKVENYGMVVAEALMSGVPVAVTARSPWTRIEEQGAGWLIEEVPADIDRAIRDILSLTIDGSAKYSVSARRLGLTLGIGIATAQINNLYQQLLGDQT